MMEALETCVCGANAQSACMKVRCMQCLCEVMGENKREAAIMWNAAMKALKEQVEKAGG